MLVHNFAPQTAYQCDKCMLISEAIRFEIVWGRLVTEAECLIEQPGEVIYAGQDNLSPDRKQILFWGQQATRQVVDDENGVSGCCEGCANVLEGGPIIGLHTTPATVAVKSGINTLLSMAGGLWLLFACFINFKKKCTKISYFIWISFIVIQYLIFFTTQLLKVNLFLNYKPIVFVFDRKNLIHY